MYLKIRTTRGSHSGITYILTHPGCGTASTSILLRMFRWMASIFSVFLGCLTLDGLSRYAFPRHR